MSARGSELINGFWFDVFLRVFLACLFVALENAEPFERKIHENELWFYQNPRTESYVSTGVLWPVVFLLPVFVILVIFSINKDKIDLYEALMSVTLALGLNGVVTDTIKLIVGRPRPDFYWRCFPDGQSNPEFQCTGDAFVVRDGRKSFPSGHSSFAFASFSFISLYLAGKFHTFSLSGKGHSWRLCLFIGTMCIALCVALSRTCDYHHHVGDVTVGSLIGLLLSFTCYRHYYPPLGSQFCHKPYASLKLRMEIDGDIKSLKEEQIKWI